LENWNAGGKKEGEVVENQIYITESKQIEKLPVALGEPKVMGGRGLTDKRGNLRDGQNRECPSDARKKEMEQQAPEKYGCRTGN